jgi:hypothetical protein
MHLFEESRPQISCKLREIMFSQWQGRAGLQDQENGGVPVAACTHQVKARDCGWKEGSIAILQFIKRVQCGTEIMAECGKLKLS